MTKHTIESLTALSEDAIQMVSQVAAGVTLFPSDSDLIKDRIAQAKKARAALQSAISEVLAERDQLRAELDRYELIGEELRDVRAERDALAKDAESWRKYKARKDAVIAAGMGKNVLREEAYWRDDMLQSD